MDTESELNQINPSIAYVFNQWVLAGGFQFLPCLKAAYASYYARGWQTGLTMLSKRTAINEGDVTVEDVATLCLQQAPEVLLTDDQRLFLEHMPAKIQQAFIQHALVSGQVDAQAQREKTALS